MSTRRPPTTAYDTVDNLTRPLPPPNRRRDKPQLSCRLCRKRKLKCDRGQPCETCTRRGLSLSCTYVQSTQTSEKSEKSEPKPVVYLQMQEKIAQLEKLVISQIQDRSHTTKENPDRASNTSKGSTHLSCAVSKHESDRNVSFQSSLEPSTPVGKINMQIGASYEENTNWDAILDRIHALKDFLVEEDREANEGDGMPEKEAGSDGPELLFRSCCKQCKRSDILAAIPPRETADQLISNCFNSVDIVPVMIHSPTFLSEYERFWDNPGETPMLWLGQLFAMMGLAVLYQQSSSNDQGSHLQSLVPQRQLLIYRDKASQCLAVGGYTLGGSFAMEALLLYTHLEYLIKTEVGTGLWVLLGMIIRLALRMGYHRDTEHYHQISPFQSEMRRRVWAVIFMMDATASAQFGLPRMIRASQSSTQEPRNLLDEDISEDMTQLPPARSDSIQTPAQFLVAKNRLMAASSKIADLSTLTQQPQYAETLRLDGILQAAFDSIPQWLTTRSIKKSIMDSPKIIIQRIYAALIYYKAKCILHRPYILKAKKDTRYIYSRTACLEATLEILKIQQVLDQETKKGGRLHACIVPSFVKSDFLLATIVLCVDVSHSVSEEATLDSRNLKDRRELDESSLKALHGAYLIWTQYRDSSRDAYQAANVVKGVLEKVQQWRAGKLIVGPAKAPSANTNEGDTIRQPSQASTLLLSNDPDTMNARITATNPTFLPFIPATASFPVLDFSEMDFEMGNWWDSENFTPPGSREPDHDPRTFGWILPGGGNHDAF